MHRVAAAPCPNLCRRKEILNKRGIKGNEMEIATGKGRLDVWIDTSIPTVVLRRRPVAPPPLVTNVAPACRVTCCWWYCKADAGVWCFSCWLFLFPTLPNLLIPLCRLMAWTMANGKVNSFLEHLPLSTVLVCGDKGILYGCGLRPTKLDKLYNTSDVLTGLSLRKRSSRGLVRRIFV